MRYILWIEWDGFYASLCEPSDQPMIVTRDSLVLDANPAARTRGVVFGMEVKQAKTLAYGCVIRPWVEDEYVELRNTWLDLCCEYSGVIEPIDQHVAALDLSGHPQPIDISERIIRVLADRFRMALNYGASTTKWIAQLAAHRGDLGLATRSPEQFVANLDIKDLLPVPLDLRERLSFLGYRKIGQVAELPIETLRRQFGPYGLLIYQASHGGHFEAVRAEYPLDSVRECLLFESVVTDCQTIAQTTSLVAKRLGERVLEQGLQGTALELTLEYDGSPPVTHCRTFTKPVYNSISAIASTGIVLQSFGLQPPLDSEPLSEFDSHCFTDGITGIRIALRDLKRVEHRQKTMGCFVASGSHRHGADDAVKLLEKTFGGGVVKLGSEIETPRRVRVLREWQIATGWR